MTVGNMAACPPGHCPLCGGAELTKHLPARFPSAAEQAHTYRCTSSEYGRHPEILRCRACRFVFLAQRPTPDQLSQLYGDVQDPLYEAEEAGRQVTFDAHLERLERIVGSPDGRRLLDVGAYTGVAVEAASRRGWDAVGIDPCRWAVESGARRGRRLIHGTPEDEAVARLGPFDVVTLWDVIEHVADPAAVVRRLYGQLHPGGYMAVHTMDVDSLFARVSGKRWPWYMEMHLFYFSPSTLTELLRMAGFEVIHVEHRGRTVSLSYLASRLAALWPSVGRPVHATVARTALARQLVRVGFGDLFTVVARRPLLQHLSDTALPSPSGAARRSSSRG